MKNLITRPLRLAMLVAVLICQLSTARAQAWQWAASPGSGYALHAITDPQGNVYVTGSFGGTASFGTTTFSTGTVASMNLFVAKYDQAGTCLWARQVAGDNLGGFGSASLTVDPAGSVYVAGSFCSASAAFGPLIIRNASPGMFGSNQYDRYVAKISPAGVWQWAVSQGGAGNDFCHDIAFDAATGSLYLTGYSGVSIGVVCQLDMLGNWNWTLPMTGAAIGHRVRAAPGGGAYVCGNFNSTTTFGTASLTSRGPSDGFVALIDHSGTWQWATAIGGSANDNCYAIATTPGGDLYAAGVFESPSLTLGATTLQNPGASSGFVARLTGGTWQWAQALTSPTNAFISDVQLDSAANPIIIAGFETSANFGATPVAGGTGNNLLIARLTPGGTCAWQSTTAGLYANAGWRVGMLGGDRYFVPGFFRGAALTLGSTSLVNPYLPYASMLLGVLGPTSVGLPADQTPPSRLVLAPNPAHETVRLTGATTPTADVIDALGRTVRTSPLEPGTSNLNLKGLPPGFYTVRAGTAARRLVVE